MEANSEVKPGAATTSGLHRGESAMMATAATPRDMLEELDDLLRVEGTMEGTEDGLGEENAEEDAILRTGCGMNTVTDGQQPRDINGSTVYTALLEELLEVWDQIGDHYKHNILENSITDGQKSVDEKNVAHKSHRR